MRAYNVFLNSFKKINASYVYVILFDVLFWLVAIVGYNLWFSGISEWYNKAVESMAIIQGNQDYALLSQNYAVLSGFVKVLALYSLIFAVVLFVAWCLSRIYIWSTILNKNVNKNLIKKFFLLNLVWLPINLLITLLVIAIIAIFGIISKNLAGFAYQNNINIAILWLLNIVPLLFIIFPLLLFLITITDTLYIRFFKRVEIKKALKEMLDTIIDKIKVFYIHYLFIGVLILVATYILVALNNLNSTIYLAGIISITVILTTWYKFYILEII